MIALLSFRLCHILLKFDIVAILVVIVVFVGLKKGVRQRHRFDVRDLRVVENVGVDEEKDGHIHRFSRQQSLFLKAKALYFGKVQSDFGRMHIVRSDSGNGLVGMIRDAKKGQGRFAGHDLDIELDRHKAPGHDVRHGRIKPDGDQIGIRHGPESPQPLNRLVVRPRMNSRGRG